MKTLILVLTKLAGVVAILVLGCMTAIIGCGYNSDTPSDSINTISTETITVPMNHTVLNCTWRGQRSLWVLSKDTITDQTIFWNCYVIDKLLDNGPNVYYMKNNN